MKKILMASMVAGLWLLAMSLPAGRHALAATVTGACDFDGGGAGPSISGSFDGTTVAISGSGWQSEEALTVSVIDANFNSQPWSGDPSLFVADEQGNISLTGTVTQGAITGVEVTGTITQASCGITFGGSN